MSAFRLRERGVSLIELMVALAIGSLLILGLVEVFSASRTAYQLSEGIARVQENGRFAMDYIQRDFRMAGHLGCVNDQARFLSENAAGTRSALASTFLEPADQSAENYAAAYVPYALRFDIPLQGYEFNGTAPGTTLPLPATPVANANLGDWTPALPLALGAAISNRIGGSDILVLRQFSPRGAQLTAFAPGDPAATLTVVPGQWGNLTEGDDDPRLLGVADCMNAGVFHASALDPGTGTITITKDGTYNRSPMGGNEPYMAGQAYVYKAETLVYYVGLNAAGNPALYRLRVDLNAAGALDAQPEELVEGIESMQLRYGVDSQPGDNQRPSGNMGTSTVAAAATPWRRVGLIQVGLVARSVNAAAVQQRDENATPLSALGVVIDPPDDTRYRAVYESSIALRNRLFGH